MSGYDAGFLDPFYSPGLDFCSYTAHHAQSMIASALEGVPPGIKEANQQFSFCFRSWFEAIYLDKYYYIGDAELMSAAFLLDIGSYHLGPVRESLPGGAALSEFPFRGKPGHIVAKILTFWNRRLVVIAKKKKAAGRWGDKNADRRLLIGGFLPNHLSGWLMLNGIIRWLVAEWRALGLSEVPESEGIPATSNSEEEALSLEKKASSLEPALNCSVPQSRGISTRFWQSAESRTAETTRI